GFDESSATHYLTGSSGTGVSTLFKDETERILPYSPQTHFDVADVAQQQIQEEEAGNNTTNSADDSSWQDKLKGFADDVKDGAEYWGGRIKDGVGNLWDSITGN